MIKINQRNKIKGKDYILMFFKEEIQIFEWVNKNIFT